MTVTLIDTIVVPQGAEYQAVCRGLSRAQVQGVRVIKIPIGSQNSFQILQKRDFWSVNSSKTLLIGLGGGLASLHSVGDVLLYQSCSNLEHQQLTLVSELNQLIQAKIAPKLVPGLTSDRPVCLASEKIQLGQKYSAMAVDMESYGYIKVLQAQGITVAVVRVISDDLQGNIPDLSEAIDHRGNLKPKSMAIAFLQQPLAALRLIKGSLQALKVLEATIYQLFLK